MFPHSRTVCSTDYPFSTELPLHLRQKSAVTRSSNFYSIPSPDLLCLNGHCCSYCVLKSGAAGAPTLCYEGCFAFLYEFKCQLVDGYQKPIIILLEIALTLDQSGERWHVNNIDFQIINIYQFRISLSGLVIFSVQGLHILSVTLIYSIF